MWQNFSFLKQTFFNICLIIFVASPRLCFTQELSYIHYDTKDGLAGSTVYDICQDKDGFIWFATETGLSRFDGKTFKNYTVNDGLPDNEILRVFADSRGRVWIMPFKKSICYYYQNKLYTSENNDLIKKIKPESSIIQISEDEDQNIILGDERKLILIRNDNNVIDLYGPQKTGNLKPVAVSVTKNIWGKGFFVRLNDSLFDYKNNSFAFDRIEKIVYDNKAVPLIEYKNGRKYWLKLPYAYITYFHPDNSLRTYINTDNGCLLADTIKKAIIAHYLPGEKISRSIEDDENNLWFSTLGNGVYKLASKEVRTFNFNKQKQTENTEVYSLSKNKNKLICGLGFGTTVILNKGKLFKSLNFNSKSQNFNSSTLTAKNPRQNNRLFCSKTLTSGVSLLGFDSYLVKLENDIPSFKSIYPIKTIEEINKDFIIVGTSGYAFKIRVRDLQITDTIWSGRCTKVFYSAGKYYIGTLNGLYEINDKKESKYPGYLYPSLKGRITDIKLGDDQILYVATADNGLTLYKDNKVIALITEKNGLSSNICRTLFLSKDYLLIGTNKGINKLNIHQINSTILKYTTSDGLPSDIINALYAEEDTIWVGTPAGLTFFNEKNISNNNLCRTVLLSVKVSGENQAFNSDLQLPYSDNNIEFEYAGISFKSGGDIEYHYKLEGLDSKWNSTRQNSLTYESLPYGDYKFLLYTVNKFGLKSNIININFRVYKPIWKNPWLYGILFFAAILITVWIVNRRNKRTQFIRHEQHKTELQFITLEQQALQAQMNPHFIFNCLNSIQQYILINDKEKANEFLTGFASLVRQTLENSNKRHILLSDEIDYLNKYLQMEKMRFANNFNYTITIGDNIDINSIEIPSLLLQPFVENCLRHGIRYKEDGTGMVNISFLLKEKTLVCRIKDNGVGRRKANEYKSRQHIEYQSRGMKLTEKRMELINKMNNLPITIEIFDLQNEEGEDSGTEVKVNIPISVL